MLTDARRLDDALGLERLLRESRAVQRVACCKRRSYHRHFGSVSCLLVAGSLGVPGPARWSGSADARGGPVVVKQPPC